MTAEADLRERVEEALAGDPFLQRLLGAATVEGALRAAGGSFVMRLADGTTVLVEPADDEQGWRCQKCVLYINAGCEEE